MIKRSSPAPRLALKVASVAVLLGLTGAAHAQTQTQQPKPAAKTSQAQPAKNAPAAPTQVPAQPQAQGAPAQIPAIPFPWMKRCQESPQINKTVCSMQQFIITDDGRPLVQFGITDIKDDPRKAFTVSFPTGMRILLRNGFRVALANEQPVLGTFSMCDERECIGDVQVDGAFIDRMKKAPGLTIQVANAVGRLISYPIGLGDFAKVYDGPDTDPKVFDEQVKKIQEQVKAKLDQQKADAQARDEKTKQGLEKLGAEKLKGAAPAQ